MKIDNLKKFAININDKARENKLDLVIGRENEISSIIRILSRKSKNNPILIGQPGVGKTAIVEGLALRIINNDVPSVLKNKEIYSLDLGSLVAGAKFQGEFEERLKAVMQEVSDNQDKIILFIDEIHMIIGAGKTSGSMDAANLLKPMLARGELNCIGATTLSEYRENIEKDPAFERRFQKILVEEPSQKEALTILRGIKNGFETYHQVQITDDALISAVEASSRYISDRFLPDKAIDLIDEASANVNVQLNSEPESLEKLKRECFNYEVELKAIKSDKSKKEQTQELKEKISELKDEIKSLESKWQEEKSNRQEISHVELEIRNAKMKLAEAKNNLDYETAAKYEYDIIPSLMQRLEKINNYQSDLLSNVVGSEEIYQIISRLTNIPLTSLLKSEKEKLLNLKNEFSKRVIGQEKAIEEVTNAVIRSKVDLNDPNKPIGSFLFIGPTGVGKTEVAKTLASELMNDEKKIIRIDMSEYMESHSVAKLIGAPPGYIGYEQGGYLTEAVRRNPYSIVLFDEIEKAHPEVLNILLQLLDEGTLTDSRGNIINFKNTVVILTSNIGSKTIMDNPNVSLDELRHELLMYIKPEIYNRIDSVIKYNSLTEEDYLKIFQIQFAKLQERFKSKEINLHVSDEALNLMVKATYSKEFGARPIKRYIQSSIENEIAYELLKHEKISNIDIKAANNDVNIEVN